MKVSLESRVISKRVEHVLIAILSVSLTIFLIYTLQEHLADQVKWKCDADITKEECDWKINDELHRHVYQQRRLKTELCLTTNDNAHNETASFFIRYWASLSNIFNNCDRWMTFMSRTENK